MSEQSVLIGWLVLSDAEKRRAREYLRQLQVEGTLDELGFGAVRDTLANVFFPATNTIMTRTRYVMFLAAIFLRIEKKRLSGPAAAKRLKDLEDELREILDPTEKEQHIRDAMKGVIGVSAKDGLQRYPSSIYWNTLKQLGLFTRSGWSLRYYLDHLTEYYDQSRARQDDDKSSHLATAEKPCWDPELEEILRTSPGISPKLEFQTGADFQLSRAEARYLKARFAALAADGRPSLLAHLLEQKYEVEFWYPWEVPCPKDLKPLVQHAQAYSALAKGATLQYYDMLIEEQRSRGWKVSVRTMADPFAKWWKLTRNILADWDFDSFAHHCGNDVPARSFGRVFLADWLKLCREAADGRELLRDPKARKLVREREEDVRPNKHRLGNEKYLHQWEPPESLDGPWYASRERLPYLLDYRSEIGSIFVREIAAGLKAKA